MIDEDPNQLHSDEAFGPSLADCLTCELHPRCHGKRTRPVLGSAAADPIGLMIIGEAPNRNEVTRGTPFAGPSGHVLDDILEAANLKREQVHLTNVVLGSTPKREGTKGKKTLHGRFPHAIYACLPRLEAEIAARKPRVIVTMGEDALTAVMGYTVQKNRHVPTDCQHCDPKTRKVGPAIACAQGSCNWYWHAPGKTDSVALEEWEERRDELGGKCPDCSANVKRLKMRAIKCPHCGGRKTKVISEELFKADGSKLLGKNGIAGGLFAAKDLPSQLDQLGVEWVIPTLHPGYLLHSKGDKGLGGQFAALVVLDHIEKAKRLLERPPVWDLEVELTDQADVLLDYIYGNNERLGPAIYDADIETDAKSAWDVSDIRCIGFGRPDMAKVLVVDPRRMIKVTVHNPNIGKADTDPQEPLEYEVEILDEELHAALQRVLTTIPTGWQNGSYDSIAIWRLWGFTVGPIAADTKVAHHCYRPDEPHTLSHIAAGLTDTRAWKEPKTMKGEQQWESYQHLVLYNAKDVRNTSLARERMVGRLVKQ